MFGSASTSIRIRFYKAKAAGRETRPTDALARETSPGTKTSTSYESPRPIFILSTRIENNQSDGTEAVPPTKSSRFAASSRRWPTPVFLLKQLAPIVESFLNATLKPVLRGLVIDSPFG